MASIPAALSSLPPVKTPHHVVIVGGGFGGLYAAKQLGSLPHIRVTLIDKRNFHLFQPLLYQVATGGLGPSDIASPLRLVLNRHKNVAVIMGEAVDLDPDRRRVILRDGEVAYDSLIVATGSKHHYFGNDHFADLAPGLKTLEDAIDMRHRVLLAFEAAEREPDPERRKAWLTFVIVGGGPTGVELAGSIAELANRTLKKDFRRIDPTDAQIVIVEGSDRVLPVYPDKLSAKAKQTLNRMKVDVINQSLVTDIQEGQVTVKNRQGDSQQLAAHTVIWAAGVKASRLGQVIAEKTGAETDRIGRVLVTPFLTVPHYDNVYVVGDLAHYAHQTGQPLPGVAPVAMQQGQYVAQVLRWRSQGQTVLKPFHYNDKGSMAVIGKNKAVAKIGGLQFDGFFAWLLWITIHVLYLVEFDNRVAVAFQWMMNYFFRKRSARLITVKDPYPLCCSPAIDPMVHQPHQQHNAEVSPQDAAGLGPTSPMQEEHSLAVGSAAAS